VREEWLKEFDHDGVPDPRGLSHGLLGIARSCPGGESDSESLEEFTGLPFVEGYPATV
jgi:hypothetical protein